MEETSKQKEKNLLIIPTNVINNKESIFENDNLSLQDHFKKFRQKKIQQEKFRQNLKKKADLRRKDPDYKQKLRNKFVNQIKQYLGVPYKQKYHKPGTELYNSKIFLDCCALIRRAMLDLKEDFGFQIGGGNQSYQYDVLPIDLKFEEMKPGDLIFYSATYYPEKKMKIQKHDMVHVEVFYGGDTGESSIGARWGKGVVTIFDSYKFVSKNYYNVKHHFKSIDTWLEGICV